jgi:ribosomal protein S18 acetylase RimI-like enzyme
MGLLSPPVQTVVANLDTQEACHALTTLLDTYARDPMGMGQPLEAGHGDNLVAGLRQCPTALVFLAYAETRPVGLAVCFLGFSTFAARPLVNIHDLVVHPDFRRRGVAAALMNHVERVARERGCCKTTLEVRPDNEVAQSLYRKLGFGPGNPPYEFWSKTLPD